MPALKDQKQLEAPDNGSPLPVTVRPEPLKVLYQWKAPSRPFKKRDREYFTTLWAIALLVGLILLLLQEWVLIVVIVALLFLNFIMNTIPPEEIEYSITNRGLAIGKVKYAWLELRRFWFAEKWGQKILYVDTVSPLPGRLTLMMGNANQAEIQKVLSLYILFEEPEKTWADRASERLSSLVRLEKTS